MWQLMLHMGAVEYTHIFKIKAPDNTRSLPWGSEVCPILKNKTLWRETGAYSDPLRVLGCYGYEI